MKLKRTKRYSFYTRKYLPLLKMLFYILIVGLNLGLLYLLLFVSPFLSLRKIELTGPVEFASRDDMRKMLETNFLYKNTLLLKTKEVEGLLLRNFPSLKFVSVKKLISSIKVALEESKPLAVLDARNGNFLLDSEGYVLGYATSSHPKLPILILEQDIFVGTFLDDDLIAYFLELNQLLLKNEINISSMSADNNYLDVYVDDIKVSFSKDQDKIERVGVLKALLAQFKVDGKYPSKIDLRYDKVIVSFD